MSLACSKPRLAIGAVWRGLLSVRGAAVGPPRQSSDFFLPSGLLAKSSSCFSLIPVRVFLPSRLRSSSAPMNLRCFSVLAGMRASFSPLSHATWRTSRANNERRCSPNRASSLRTERRRRPLTGRLRATDQVAAEGKEPEHRRIHDHALRAAMANRAKDGGVTGVADDHHDHEDQPDYTRNE